MALGLTLLILMLLPALTSACGRGPTPLPKALSSPTTTPTPVQLPASTATKERLAQPLTIATQAKEPTPKTTPTLVPRATSLPAATAIPARSKIPATSSEGPALSEDAATLSLELASGQPAPGREFTLAVKLEPRGPGISGVQFRLDFPQNWMELLDIIPGTALGPTPLEVTQTGQEPDGRGGGVVGHPRSHRHHCQGRRWRRCSGTPRKRRTRRRGPRREGRTRKREIQESAGPGSQTGHGGGSWRMSRASADIEADCGRGACR